MAVVTTAALVFAVLPQVVRAEDDEAPPFRPGLVATSTLSNGQAVQRVTPDAILGAPQSGLDYSTYPVAVSWSGLLRVVAEGEYQFALAGSVSSQVKLSGEALAVGKTTEAGWTALVPVELSLDNHALTITCTALKSTDHLRVYWKGPQFDWEPLSPRHLIHLSKVHPPDEFARGEALAHALRCTHCHAGDSAPTAYLAPTLEHLQGNIRRDWLVQWLAAKEGAKDEFRRMPAFDLTAVETEALADFLLERSTPANKVELKPTLKSRFMPTAEEGRTLALTLGCLACHKVGEFGQVGLFGGGDLTHIADKRPPEFFARWLTDPAALNPAHRMPVFDLTPAERDHLATYLATLKPKPPAQAAAPAIEAKLDGKKLYFKLGCAACHEPARDASRSDVPKPPASLDGARHWEHSCSGPPERAKDRPGFSLPEVDRAALQTYFTAVGVRNAQVGPSRALGFAPARRLRELNCRACHMRDDWAERAAADPQPLAALLKQVAEEEDALAPLVPALTPPSLNSVGDKLQDAALLHSILRKQSEHRPYLRVRMPRFPLSWQDGELLANHFIYHDRIPLPPLAEPKRPDDLVLAAGGKLTSTEGFGCVSCHQVGSWQPLKAPLNARGPELLMLGGRIRRDWFNRWVKNPARIVPRMEMPSLQLPVRGVLDNQLNTQIDALWTALNTPGFTPPLPGAVRVVRKSGALLKRETATVLTDVLEAEGNVHVKPFVVALPNRHNVLFDLEAGRLARWWVGDAASQKTRGKSWYWEVVEPNLLSRDDQPEFEFRMPSGPWRSPQRQGQFVTEVETWRHESSDTLAPGSVEWTYRLLFPAAGEQPARRLTVVERIDPRWDAEHGGFRRTLQIHGAPVGAEVRWRTGVKDGVLTSDSRDESKPFLLHFDYQSKLPIQETVAPPHPTIVARAGPVAIAPGWTGARLPVPEEIMPTAFAWRPSGKLVFASLKGNFWQTSDTNRDGVPDSAEPWGDELAAPYGLATGPGYVDVATKFALLRLHGEERCEQVETLASGWGHTADYHDWAVGLPQDAAGNYYLTIPGHVDKRSPEAAKLRGTAIKLTPQTPTPESPRRFKIDELATGLRFPMGIALSRQGALFVTDNQGQFNPFNELNHIRPGADFGFVNGLGKRTQAEPATPTAIDIPHPWMRSVNGLCFLDTPEPLRKDRGNLFGPFEGHLVGCEYDTRRLIRMSLQEVEGVYQGAAYPLSIPPANATEGLLGPVVCAVSPRGELYVGSLRDSGWGGGNNIGDIVRITFDPAQHPCGIAEVRAEKDGLRIAFTKPVPRDKAADAANYRLASYRRESTPAYGGPDLDRRDEKLERIEVAEDRLSAKLVLRELRPGCVYEIFLKNLTANDPLFFPAEAHFTLRKVPQ